MPTSLVRAIPNPMKGLDWQRFPSFAAALLAVVIAGCASTGTSSRRASTARGPASVADDPSAELHPSAPAVDEPVVAGLLEAAPTHRLRHTITLGASYGDGSAPPTWREGPTDPAAPSPLAPPVYVVLPTYGYGYGSYGYGYGGYGYGYPGCYGCDRPDLDRRPAKPRPSPDRPPGLGEDWSPPPSYGPRFPFKTPPAEPGK